MRMLAVSLLSLSLSVSCGGLAEAQERTDAGVPEGTQFIVFVDLDAFRETKVGGQLFEAATQAAIQEIGDGEQGLEQVREALGFDPLTEVHSLTVFGSDFEDPEDNLQVIIRMGQTTGNLEGLLLALPEYASETVGDQVYHRMSPERGMTVHLAIHTDDGGNKSLVAATNRSAVDALLQGLDAGRHPAGELTVEGAFVHVNVLKLPAELLDDGPQANIAKLMKKVSVTVGEADDHFHVHVQLGLEDEQKAEQIRQMAQGAVAMIAFVQDGHDEDLKRIQELLQGLTVERRDADVSLQLRVPAEKVVQFLREEADLPL